MKKLLLLVSALLLLTASNASAIYFDTNGAAAGGTIVDIVEWDWAPSSALAKGGIDIAIDDIFTLYAHGLLTGGKASDGTQLGDFWGDDKEITFVTGFKEEVVDMYGSSLSSTAVFSVVNDATNFFEVYIKDKGTADDSLQDGSAGTGFNNSGNAELLFKGVVVNDPTGLNQFVSSLDPTKFTLLDQFDDGTAPVDDATATDAFGNGTTQKTVVGSGDTTIDASILVTDFNPAYFIGAFADTSVTLNSTTGTKIPFKQVDPSNWFWDANANGGLGGYVFADIGIVNGAPSAAVLGVDPQTGAPIVNGGTDFIFQTDVTTSGNASYVPEPGSMLLLGFGLLSLAGFVRRKEN